MTVAPRVVTSPSTPLPLHRRKAFRVAVAAFLAVVLIVIGGFTIHIPAYSAGPGPARDVGKLIGIKGRRAYPSRGAFLLTTVAVSARTLSLFGALQAWLDPASQVIPKDAIVAPGRSDEQQDVINRQEMEESKVEAEVVAMRALGYRVAPEAGGRVVVTVPGSPAAAVLRPRDIVIGVDGRRVADVDAAVAAIRSHRIGDRVRVTYLRAGAVHSTSFKVVESFLQPDSPSIGAVLSKAFRLPFQITIDTQTISGPSGGLVFALALADALTRDDLTGGHRIAATGTIDEEGSVGEIGGVEEKLRAAKHSRADVFLVPAPEVAQARKHAGSIRIIGVRTLKGAIRALRSLAPRRAS